MAFIERKKLVYPITPPLREYLTKYGREAKLPVGYDDLNRYDNAITLFDKSGTTRCGKRCSTRSRP
jgi:hypothetical protein